MNIRCRCCLYLATIIFVLNGCTKNNPVSTETTEAPIIIYPSYSATNVSINPTFVWNVFKDADSYTLQVSVNRSFNGYIYNVSGITDTFYTVTGLSSSAVYFWRVNSNDGVETSDWSNIWWFTGGSIEYVSIPAGSFKMGSTENDTAVWEHSRDEYPQHSVYLDAFSISKYEITNAQFKAFMDAGGYTNSAYWSTEGWTWRVTNDVTAPYYWQNGYENCGPGFPNHPISYIYWYEADAFCRWAGGNLPTEAQWEKAARGTDSSNCWPWGAVWDASKCNSGYNVLPDTFVHSSPAGFFSAGQSPYGVFDMTGNVLEWCNDWYASDYYAASPSSNPAGPASGTSKVYRGGSWFFEDNSCRVAKRKYSNPDGINEGYGLRVVLF